MVRIAVTGGIACGKTLVGSFLAAKGVPVRDADDVTHELMEVGQPVYDSVVAAFGKGSLGPDGAIDRDLLGRRVFADADARGRLEAIVHPEVRKACREWMAAEAAKPAPPAVVAVIVPLLNEVGWIDDWDTVVCVTASEKTRLDRLTARGLSKTAALERMAAQMPSREKTVLADYVISNDGTMDLLKEQAHRVLESILEK